MRWYHRVSAIGVALFTAACADQPTPTELSPLPVKPLLNTVVRGAAFTTVNEDKDGPDHCKNGNPDVNCNIYDEKEAVWLNGGPVAASLGDGTYFFAVLEPGGQGGNDNPNDGELKNLSDGANGDYTTRTFSISGGTITYDKPPGTHDFADNKIRLFPYDDSSNPVYILAICSLADADAEAANQPGVDPSDCKYDAFKIGEGGGGEAGVLTADKTASGAYDKLYKWTIKKAVDKTKVTALNGTATFNYTVTVEHDAGTISGIKVTGTITVVNPNSVGVEIDGVDDQLSDGTVCTVTGGGPQTLPAGNSNFAYTCSIAGTTVPTSLTNTATVTWPKQVLDDGSLLLDGTATVQKSVSFTGNEIDESIDVTDSYTGTLGTVTVGDANPKSFTYSRTVPIPTYGCKSYDNTATFTTNDTGTTGSAGQTVEACRRPPVTGAKTIGFWQNKNGQAIITGGASLSGVCKSGTWLRQYAPYQDLSATASCSQVGSYVTNIIKAANSSGAAMNAMLKAQMLATALDVYFSDPALGGNKINAPAPIGGIKIDLTAICKMIDGSGGTATCSGTFQNVSSAFGGNTSLTVLQMITYAASQSNVGGSTWYANVKATQELAKNAFDAINNEVAFQAP